MADLSTTYMGIPLKNPIVAGASTLTSNRESLLRLQASGAAAVVYRSLFEEQIQSESVKMQQELEWYNDRHAEMITLFPDLKHAGPEEHLTGLKEAKGLLDIPVIASLNCVTESTWVDYAKQLEATGVDGLELNFFAVPREFDQVACFVEDSQVEIVEQVANTVKIPVSVKLSPFYSNTLDLIKRMENAGAKGFVVFNRLFEPDIDLNKLTHNTPFMLSSQGDYRQAMRYAGLLHGNIDASIIGNSGIFTGEDVAKMIIAGADAVQIVSVLYKNGESVIQEILSQLNLFMEGKNYKSLNDFRGLMSKAKLHDPFAYRRSQYIDTIIHSDVLVPKNQIV